MEPAEILMKEEFPDAVLKVSQTAVHSYGADRVFSNHCISVAFYVTRHCRHHASQSAYCGCTDGLKYGVPAQSKAGQALFKCFIDDAGERMRQC